MYHGRVPEERPQSWSIAHQAGRISIQRPDGVLINEPRKESFVPGPDTISTRRLTHQADTPEVMIRKASVAVGNAMSKVLPKPRQSSIVGTYEKAKARQQQLQRSKPVQILFEYSMYFLLLAFVYFVLVGQPLWGGVVWWVASDHHGTDTDPKQVRLRTVRQAPCLRRWFSDLRWAGVFVSQTCEHEVTTC